MRTLARLLPLLFIAVSLASAQTKLIGSSSIASGLDMDAAGQAEAFQQTAAVTGTVTTMSVYLDASNSATKVFVGLFSDAGGHPKTLLGSGTIAAPTAFPYTTGDMQWNTFSFKYGVVVYRAQFPTYQTVIWPAVWMLGSNCQNSNKYTGDTGLNGCPNLGSAGYGEIDNTELYGGASEWGRFNIANPGWSVLDAYPSVPIDANYHTYGTVWTANGLQQYLDDHLQISSSQTVNQNMFLIVQNQTGGLAGVPNNSLLPASVNVDYVKVCNSTYTLSQCEAAASADPNVIFYDDFGGPAH